MRQRRSAHGMTGFTLVETMWAAAIFAIGTLAAFAYFSSSQMRLNLDARRRVAVELANSRLEECRTYAYEDLLSCTETSTQVTVEGVTGTRQTTVLDVDEDVDGQTDYRQLTVRIAWNDMGGAQNVQLVTYRSEYR